MPALQHSDSFIVQQSPKTAMTAVACLISLLLLSATAAAFRDVAFDEFTCADDFQLYQDPREPNEKLCLVMFEIPVGYAWGFVCGRLWEGDIGFWVEHPYYHCHVPRRDALHGVRTYCTSQLDYSDYRKRAPLRRIVPVCDPNLRGDGDGKMGVFGYKIRRVDSAEAATACDPEIKDQQLLCPQPGDQVGVPMADFRKTVETVAGTTPHNHVIVSIATHAYAELGWMHYMYHKMLGMPNVLVVAMDVPAYEYLVSKRVPTIFMESQMPLNPCCLRRFQMLNWRATNDVKVRSLIAMLELGVNVTMTDLDIRYGYRDVPLTSRESAELVYLHDYSFMWVHCQGGSQGVIDMWRSVLGEVQTGGWDQSQFKYWGKRLADQFSNIMYPQHVSIKRGDQLDSRYTWSFWRMLRGVQPLIPKWENRKLSKRKSKYPTKEATEALKNPARANRTYVEEAMAVMPAPPRIYVTYPEHSRCQRSLVNPQVPGWNLTQEEAWAGAKTCVAGLVLTQTAFQKAFQRRVAIVAQTLDMYDHGVLRRWFPVGLFGDFISLGGLPEPDIGSDERLPGNKLAAVYRGGTDLSRTYQAHMGSIPGITVVNLGHKTLVAEHVRSMTKRVQQVSSEEGQAVVIVLHGDPHDIVAASKRLLNKGELAALDRKLALYVAPKQPPRNQLKCMRDGGPVGPHNRDPDCPAVPHRPPHPDPEALWQSAAKRV